MIELNCKSVREVEEVSYRDAPAKDCNNYLQIISIVMSGPTLNLLRESRLEGLQVSPFVNFLFYKSDNKSFLIRVPL